MNTAATTTRPATDRRLGWTFQTPPPRLVDALIKQKKLSRVDKTVLGTLLDFRTHFKDSAWCCKRTIANELGRSEKTVQRSLDRLGEHGIIRQARVASPGHPDPDEPRNKTGWRIYFMWITTRSDFGPGPDRRPPEQRTKMSSPTRPFLSSPERSEMSSPAPRATIGPPRGELSETQESEKKYDDDGIASAEQAAEIDACTPPPFQFLSPPTPILTPMVTGRVPVTAAMPAPVLRAPTVDPMAASEPAIDLALLAALAARAASLLNVSQGVAQHELNGFIHEFGDKARAKGLMFGLFWISAALDDCEAHNRGPGNLPVRSFRFIGKLLTSYLLRHGPPATKPKPTASPPQERYHQAKPKPTRDPSLPSLREMANLARTAEEGGPRHG